MLMISLLITLVIVGLILAIVWWAISQIPMPPPFNWVVRVVFALIVAILLIDLLLGGVGGGLHLGALR